MVKSTQNFFAASRFPVGEEEEHVVRCHNVGAQHVRDQISGRYSVVVPVLVLSAPAAIKLEYPEQISGGQVLLFSETEVIQTYKVSLNVSYVP